MRSLFELHRTDEGYDQETFELGAECPGGLYKEVVQKLLSVTVYQLWMQVHDQYTYNAERRSIYPQMMLIYLVESCELIAASDSESLVRRYDHCVREMPSYWLMLFAQNDCGRSVVKKGHTSPCRS